MIVRDLSKTHIPTINFETNQKELELPADLHSGAPIKIRVKIRIYALRKVNNNNKKKEKFIFNVVNKAFLGHIVFGLIS